MCDKTVRELQGEAYEIKKKTKRSQETEDRYKPVGPPPKKLKCNHKTTKAFMCSGLSTNDIKHFHSGFYAIPKKKHQTEFILSNISVTKPERRRPEKRREEPKERSTAINYFVQGTQKRFRVCAESFSNILAVNLRRVQRIAKQKKELGYVKFESGGDRMTNIYGLKRDSVKEYIGDLSGQESHYGRNKSCKIYLNSELSIQKLCEDYNKKCHPDSKVTYQFFKHVFHKYFNLSFKSPATDVCSTCMSLKNRLKNNKLADKVRKDLKCKLRNHKNESQKFFNRLRCGRLNEYMLSADCEKNQPLPKVPDGAFYYSRQETFNHFGIVEGTSDTKLDKNSCDSYTWTEHEAKKGGNEISSFLFDKLNRANASRKLENVDKVLILMDNTVSTNKNQAVLLFLSFWLTKFAPANIRKVN